MELPLSFEGEGVLLSGAVYSDEEGVEGWEGEDNGVACGWRRGEFRKHHHRHRQLMRDASDHILIYYSHSNARSGSFTRISNSTMLYATSASSPGRVRLLYASILVPRLNFSLPST